MQDLDKKDAAAEKQRESMMLGLTKTKTELGSLQDALAKTQLDLEKTSFELHAKTSALVNSSANPLMLLYWKHALLHRDLC